MCVLFFVSKNIVFKFLLLFVQTLSLSLPRGIFSLRISFQVRNEPKTAMDSRDELRKLIQKSTKRAVVVIQHGAVSRCFCSK